MANTPTNQHITWLGGWPPPLTGVHRLPFGTDAIHETMIHGKVFVRVYMALYYEICQGSKFLMYRFTP